MMEKTARDAVAVMAIISDAYKGSKGTTDVHDRYWDHAAAKFLGTDATRGVTVFNRAQKRAANYGTLEGADAAKANSLIITALKLGKDATTTQARLAQYDAVVSQMKVIYSQCVLRYAYLVDQDIATGADYTEHQAEGQAFWRVIAPWVNAVDENGAVYLEGIFNLARAPTHSNHFCHTKEILGLMGSPAGTCARSRVPSASTARASPPPRTRTSTSRTAATSSPLPPRASPLSRCLHRRPRRRLCVSGSPERSNSSPFRFAHSVHSRSLELIDAGLVESSLAARPLIIINIIQAQRASYRRTKRAMRTGQARGSGLATREKGGAFGEDGARVTENFSSLIDGTRSFKSAGGFRPTMTG